MIRISEGIFSRQGGGAACDTTVGHLAPSFSPRIGYLALRRIVLCCCSRRANKSTNIAARTPKISVCRSRHSNGLPKSQDSSTSSRNPSEITAMHRPNRWPGEGIVPPASNPDTKKAAKCSGWCNDPSERSRTFHATGNNEPARRHANHAGAITLVHRAGDFPSLESALMTLF
jgi:hypothetical protein